ncbi:MAG: tetratricopeptide repeat protein [Planctomycetes bacterium]|nr:tetratricopeptide repeat protein [Planctomycetota bacterium]
MDSGARQRRTALVLALCLALGVVLVYLPVAGHDWVRYDDDVYLLENPHVARGLDAEALRWAFSFDGYAANYHPLTWLSHIVDVECFEFRPAGHHLVSVGLHALNAVLALYVLLALLGNAWAAGIGATLFALHPLRVESVAWAAERKDVLCATFFLAATLAYLRYGRAPSLGRYAGMVLLFVLALLAKPMAVTFPCVVGLLDLWPLRRFSRGAWKPLAPAPSLAPTHPGETRAKEPRAQLRYGLFLEKLPLFALAGLSALATVLVQSRGGATSTVDTLALGVRALNALRAVGLYLWQSVWPARLSVFYPHAAILTSSPARELALPAAVASLVLLALLALAWRLRRSVPAFALGLVWFLVLLAPVIGIIQVGTQAHADRYTYLPSLGLVAALAGAGLALGPRAARALLALGLVAALLCAGLTRTQLGFWQDTRALFAHALELEPRNYLAQMKLGEVALAEGDIPSARTAFERSLAIHAGSPEALNNLALCHIQLGEYDAARRVLERAQRIDPQDYGTWINLGVVELEQQNFAAARALFARCLERRPSDAELHFDLGHLEHGQGNAAAAEERYLRALELRPEYAEAWSNLGQVRLGARRVAEALAAFERVVALTPADPVAHFNLGIARRAQGDAAGARASFTRALELDPELEPARQALHAAGSGG